jgi:hypothetical protein
MWRSRWRCVIKSAYSFTFLLSINIFYFFIFLYFLDAPRNLMIHQMLPWSYHNLPRSTQDPPSFVTTVATTSNVCAFSMLLESSWNVMAHGDAREGKWRGNCPMEWVASTLHTTSERGVPSITTADVHTSPASSRLNWRPRRFKWTRPFRRKTKSGFCACLITFQTQSTADLIGVLQLCLQYSKVRNDGRKIW